MNDDTTTPQDDFNEIDDLLQQLSGKLNDNQNKLDAWLSSDNGRFLTRLYDDFDVVAVATEPDNQLIITFNDGLVMRYPKKSGLSRDEQIASIYAAIGAVRHLPFDEAQS